jgi:hypothetical protein
MLFSLRKDTHFICIRESVFVIDDVGTLSTVSGLVLPIDVPEETHVRFIVGGENNKETIIGDKFTLILIQSKSLYT